MRVCTPEYVLGKYASMNLVLRNVLEEPVMMIKLPGTSWAVMKLCVTTIKIMCQIKGMVTLAEESPLLTILTAALL